MRIGFDNEKYLKLQSKYKCILYADEMILLDLYKKIEKRGFRVLYNNESISDSYFINAIIDVEQSR